MTTISKVAFLWLHVVLILVVNLAVMFALLFFKSPKINKFIQPIFISLFVLTTIYYSDIPSNGTIFYFAFFMLIFNPFADSYNSDEGRDLSEQENDTIDNNEENHSEAIESSPNEQAETPNEKTGTANEQAETTNEQAVVSNEPKQSFTEKLNDINCITFFFILIVWVTDIEEAISNFSRLRYFGESDQLINNVFFYLFVYAIYQFIYGMLVLNDNPPKWLYLFYMIPVAILYPLSSFFAYYIANSNDFSLSFFLGDNDNIFGALKLYISFKLLHQFIQGTSSEGELNNKIINVAMLAVSFLILVFIRGIATMGT